MKKLIVVITIIAVMLSGCGGPIDTETYERKSTSFVKVESTLEYEIVYHRDTKVMYVASYRGGYTVMVDENGMPLLWEDQRSYNEQN